MVKHLSEELASTGEKVSVQTRYGEVTGGKAENGAFAFLEVPYALPPRRFEDPEPLPDDYKYESKEFIYESKYAAQPTNDGQAVGVSDTDKLGLGQPTEDTLFLNIVIPPSFDPKDPAKSKFPVKVYIHGGFLQFGSPHGMSAQAQHAAVARGAVYVNIGYRLSVFGFLACDNPPVAGNFGFKDQWLALLWIRDNIASFGGDPNNVELTGLSAGAHSVHQILYHASFLPEDERAPFRTVVMQSNAIVFAPKTPSELRPQFAALCHALEIQYDSNTTAANSSANGITALEQLKAVPWQALTRAISAGALGSYGTFRGCLDNTDWLFPPPPPSPLSVPPNTNTNASAPDPLLSYQRTQLGPSLRQRGVEALIAGDVSDEWYLYSLADPIETYTDIEASLARYYPSERARALLGWAEVWYAGLWKLARGVVVADASASGNKNKDESEKKDENGSEETKRACFELYGRVLADAQVHLPVRMLVRDLSASGFPAVRYSIRWTPEQARKDKEGLVTHATDRLLWCPRFASPSSQSNPSAEDPRLTPTQALTTTAWLDAIDSSIAQLCEAGTAVRGPREALVLTASSDSSDLNSNSKPPGEEGKGRVEWDVDAGSGSGGRWDALMELERVLGV